MNKIERIKCAINGDKVDKLPYAFWSHFPKIDLDPKLIAMKTYDFYKTYDIDFIKTMNNGMYSIEDYGCEIDYSNIFDGGVAKLTKTPIKEPKDWLKIEELDITKGALARELLYLEELIKLLKDEEVPVIFTVFSPITTADKLSGKLLRKHIEEGHGEVIHKALENIANATSRLAEKAIEMGADGVFFASQMTSYNFIDEKTYLEYGKPYDLKVLKGASKGWFNVIHAHGDNIIFNILKDYPVQVINWHAYETLPELEEARDISGKCLMGGIKRMDITNKKKNEIRNEIYKTIKVMKNIKHILTPGCVVRYPLDDETFKFIKETKEDIEGKLSKNF